MIFDHFFFVSLFLTSVNEDLYLYRDFEIQFLLWPPPAGLSYASNVCVRCQTSLVSRYQSAISVHLGLNLKDIILVYLGSINAKHLVKKKKKGKRSYKACVTQVMFIEGGIVLLLYKKDNNNKPKGFLCYGGWERILCSLFVKVSRTYLGASHLRSNSATSTGVMPESNCCVCQEK